MRKPPFIVYFIRRRHSLPRSGSEIEFIAANQAGLRKARLPRGLTFLQGIPIATVPKGEHLPARRKPEDRRVFLVKRKDTKKLEPWLEDYLEFPEPDWHLMCVINRWRMQRNLEERSLREHGAVLTRRAGIWQIIRRSKLGIDEVELR